MANYSSSVTINELEESSHDCCSYQHLHTVLHESINWWVVRCVEWWRDLSLYTLCPSTEGGSKSEIYFENLGFTIQFKSGNKKWRTESKAVGHELPSLFFIIFVLWGPLIMLSRFLHKKHHNLESNRLFSILFSILFPSSCPPPPPPSERSV